MATASHDAPILLFDLGGVLLDFAGFDAMQALIENGMTVAQVRTKWIRSPTVQTFERGRSTNEDFARAMVEEWNLDLSPGAFLDDFGTWTRAFYPGAEGLLRSLRKHYRTGCLTNTNALHWAGIRRLADMDAMFDFQLLSFEIGLCKPDQRIFRFVEGQLNVASSSLWFFDDTPENVKAAALAGWHAQQTEGLSQVKAALARWLPDALDSPA